MNHRPFFWLHIKKSGGITTRRLLQPYYVTVDRVRKPKNFIQASPKEYNDILNNYRIVLGEYQFKRCLFAKEYLYPDSWHEMFSFAFSREPMDRCISMFYYLFWNDLDHVVKSTHAKKRSFDPKKLTNDRVYAFDVFLDFVSEARESDSIYRPLGNHFTTHTAPVWDDITDLDGMILLSKIFRLENLVGGINQAFQECGIEKTLDPSDLRLNVNKERLPYRPSQNQRRVIESIYRRDFELYDRAEK